MRAASLLLVLLFAKGAALAGSSIPLSWYSPLAFIWHDAAIVLAFITVEYGLRTHGRIVWAVYAVLAAYAVINIPVTRVLATPLTWPMLQAARGPLADSISYYVTWGNLLLLVGALTLAVFAPVLFRKLPPRPLIVPLILSVVLGPLAGARVDTRGWERNAWTTLITSALPRLRGPVPEGAWRRASTGPARHPDLSHLRGSAAGRNVLLVSLESTAAQYLGIYGARPDVMPRLSELAGSAIVFDNAYAVYPESIKGLFSVLCSMYPSLDSSPEMYAAAPCRSVAEVLDGADYRTALFHSGRFAYLGMEEVIRNRGYAILEDAGDIGGNHNSSFGVDEPSTVERILHWIDALPAGGRFFITYLPVAGHHPYETPEPGPFAGRDELERYRNALHYGDASLGVLRDGLRARGLDEKTLWVILGDHGEAFGQHQGNYGHTFHLYEENIHVPFLIAAPGLIPHPVRSGQTVSLIDTAPTLLDLLGLAIPAGYQGASVLDGEPRMALFYADYSLGLLGLRDGNWKFIHELDSGRSRLFDLEKDPLERTDLSDLYPAQTSRYEENLRAWSHAQRQRLVSGR